MRWDTTFLHNKVARRIFAVFLLCALLPITALTLISFRQVTQELEEDAALQLRQSAKSESSAIYQRLQFLVDDMGNIASALRGATLDSNPFLLGGVGRNTTPLFRGVGLLSSAGDLQVLFGKIDNTPDLTEKEKGHLRAGSTLLTHFSCGDSECPRLLRYLDFKQPERGLLISDPQPEYLWDGDKLPATTTLCVLDESGNAVHCPSTIATQIRAALGGGSTSSGNTEWGDRKNHYVAGYSTIFLRVNFHAPAWTVVLSESRASVVGPLQRFSHIFLPLIALTLLTVLLVSFVQIRRSMGPLQELERGTRGIASGQFDTRVNLASGDEFQKLAESFNGMAHHLGRQFQALEAVRDIDRAILSSLDQREIVNRVLRRVRALLSYTGISVTLVDRDQPDRAVTYVAADEKHPRIRVVGNTLEVGEVEELQQATDLIQVDTTQYTRTYLQGLSERGVKCCVLFPIRHDNQLFGVLTLGSSHPIEAPDDEAYAKQLADRLAVGLSNALLVEDLDKLNQGTFMALARAIDAKSTWTAGHSERVTKMAVEIGKAMRLAEKDLVILHRGGLLHDIGKIGTPPEILDKPGKMTDAEMRVMCEHVTVGARILEPIPGFAELIPIVVQHHERFDGSGYPFGLAGEAISLHARIFAVADVYDALISNRPYRPGWAREKVVAYIQEKVGTHFDPKVVNAFLQVMAKLDQTPAEKEHNAEDEEHQLPSDEPHHRPVLRLRAAAAAHSRGTGRR